VKFGIVQGRLTQSTELQCFPKDWAKEFPIAWALGFDYIELIAEREYNEKNPIWNGNIESPIICNDYIINHGLDRIQLSALIDRAPGIGAELIILPLMEQSALVSKEDLLEVELYAAKSNIKIALETTENDYPIPVVYDTGNRTREGLHLPRDIKELNKKIVHVHIKDIDWKGKNTLLGTGMVNFKEVCQALTDIGYDNTMTFETVRGKDPIRTAKYNLEFIKFFLAEAQ
jgi:xylose isomerase-like TIM barrel protein